MVKNGSVRLRLIFFILLMFSTAHVAYYLYYSLIVVPSSYQNIAIDRTAENKRQ